MPRALRPLATLTSIVLMSLVSAGCGSRGPSDTDAATSTSTADSSSTAGAGLHKSATKHEKGVKFSECMRGNGVPDFPDPDPKGEYAYGVSVRPAVFTKAAKACKDLEPPGALSSKRTPKQQSGALKFAACMRSNGVKDFPDSVSGEPLIDTTKIPSTDKPGGMTILNAAMQKCRSVSGLAAGGQGG